MTTKLNSKQIPFAREVLTAPRTYYVSSAWGSDSVGTGLTWETAFYSIQKAIDVAVKTLDFGGYGVTIQLAQYQGYTGFVITGWTGGGQLIIQGDTTTPANCVVTGTYYAAYAGGVLPGPVTIQGVELRAASGHGIQHEAVGLIKYGAVRFGAVANFQVYTNNVGASAQQISKCYVTGNAQSHWCANVISLINPSYTTLEFSAGVTFSFNFSYVTRNSVLQCNNMTFVGTFTGTRFLVDSGGIIYSGSAAQATYFPGTVAGTVGTNGQWL
jgi:hypothetical protein